MKIIKHRVNQIDELISTPSNFGVEIDVRTSDAELIISHEPFSSGTSFSKWLEHYSHSCLIINVKEDGLETFVLDLLNKYEIENFFFLDQSFPSLFKASKKFPELCCARVSEVESVETVLNLNVGWVWFDSHSGDWNYLHEAFEKLSSMNVKKCLVSPELQRTNSDSELTLLRNIINDSSINFDAVCTKFPYKWELSN